MATTLLTSGIIMGSSTLDVTGSAAGFTARAWVNFNGQGTVAIRSSGNVSSITDNGGTSNYTVNFTTAMPDANYAVALGMQSVLTPGVAFHSVLGLAEGGTFSTAAVQVKGFPGGDVSAYAGNDVADSSTVTVAVIR